MDTRSDREILAAIDGGLTEWRDLADRLAARFRAADAGAAATFAAGITQAATAAGHDIPEIRLSRNTVDIHLYSVDPDGYRWITAADLALASTISERARDAGITPVPADVTQVELGLDTPDHATTGPFWAALLTGDAGNTAHNSVLDPTNRGPSIWFQTTEPHPVPRQRWHLDVWLAPETAPVRIASALAAGGTVVDDTHAPACTVLADPEGNRACICTAVGR